jgi:peptide-methionine (R)-S-oxide reductase
MKNCTFSVFTLISLVIGSPSLLMGQDQPSSPGPKKKVIKTDEEWAKILTRAQFLVCRLKVTEPAFSGKLLNNHAKGTYDCVACGAELFSSRTKFNSGTGWPSFWRPLEPNSVASEVDNSAGEPRMEVLCNKCGSHLGHVFNDGPAPTGMRFCINSTALKFAPERKPAVDRKSPKAKAEEKAESDTEATPAPPEAEAPAVPTDPNSKTK